MTIFITGILTGAGFILSILAMNSGGTGDITRMVLVTVALGGTGIWMVRKQWKKGQSKKRKEKD